MCGIELDTAAEDVPLDDNSQSDPNDVSNLLSNVSITPDKELLQI